MPDAPSPRAPRLVLIGGRRTRQGLGPFLARHLTSAGAQIVAVVGSRLTTAMLAADALEEVLHQRPVPLAHADDVERLPDLDALVIASPHETHEGWLRWAGARGLHVLCEKPLVWGSAEAHISAAAHARRFAQGGRHLVVNAQHARVLRTLCHLHPDLRLERASRLAVRMAPPSRGLPMLPDALPHVLSLLYAVAPDDRARVTDVQARWGDDEGRSLSLRFTYLAAGRSIDVEAEFEQGAESPRPFALEVDGRAARREVDRTSYAMRLVDGSRSVPLPDPMAELCADFVSRVRDRAPPTVDPCALQGVTHLHEIALHVPAPALVEIALP